MSVKVRYPLQLETLWQVAEQARALHHPALSLPAWWAAAVVPSASVSSPNKND